MTTKSYFSINLLTMLVKEHIGNNKEIFLKEDSDTELFLKEDDYDKIARILSKELKKKEQEEVRLNDIDKSIDIFLKEKGYIYDCSIENRYKKNKNNNCFYFGIMELDYYSTALSMDDLIFKISKAVNRNYNKLNKNPAVKNDLVNINIVKDNSTRFDADDKKAVYKAVFNLQTHNLICNFNLSELSKMYDLI